ncbi:MAG: hypothetical protein K8R88_13345 [Armatimonadetes bacterium]|nr:hypothetical protein [Armatimonadota bacterium]
MHYFVYVSLRTFYSGVLKCSPLILVHQGKVLDACQAMRKQGVFEGMSQREAKNLVRNSGAFRELAEDDFREQRDAWLDLCAEVSDTIEPDLPHECYLDLSTHPEPYAILSELRQKLPTADIGVGPSKWVAKLSARLAQNLDSDLIRELLYQECSQHTREFLAKLSIHELTPVGFAERERLSFLGYTTIGSLKEVPIATLRRQFGKLAEPILAAARGGPILPLKAAYPENQIYAEFEVADGVHQTDVLDNNLTQLATSLLEKLKLRDDCSSELIIKIRYESRENVLQKAFPKPLSTSTKLLQAIKGLLANETEPLYKIRIELHSLKKVERKQARLDGLPEKRDAKANADIAIRKIQKVFGDQVVQVAAEIPQLRRVKVMRAWQNATGWR